MADAETTLVREILDELARARTKFPGDNVATLALVEEVGELAKAAFEESRARVREEAIQVAVLAMRVVLDGDQTLTGWRKGKGLDALTDDAHDEVGDLVARLDFVLDTYKHYGEDGVFAFPDGYMARRGDR